jgi:hypothetical protein
MRWYHLCCRVGRNLLSQIYLRNPFRSWDTYHCHKNTSWHNRNSCDSKLLPSCCVDMINWTTRNEFSHAYVTNLLSDVKNLIKYRRTWFAIKIAACEAFWCTGFGRNDSDFTLPCAALHEGCGLDLVCLDPDLHVHSNTFMCAWRKVEHTEHSSVTVQMKRILEPVARRGKHAPISI